MIDKTLVHYEIISQLGKGGMGEVYRAKDQKLGRDVAIKVLPEEFARDPERIARFEREAKLLASLNHPNIAAIHGLEESDGIHFLVLELVEGDTLADQLKSGSIPSEESLKLALQVAEALEAAHEKGVIHRDLKPANIKVTPDGKYFAYSTLKGLYLRSIDEGGTRLIAGTEGETRQPFFSPDGKWIGYVSTAEGVEGSLKKVLVGGGAPVTICATSRSSGGYFWTPDNRIIQGFGVNIRSVSADGGEWKTLSEEKSFGLLGAPQLLPDGDSVLFIVGTATPQKVMMLSLKSGKSRELFEGGCARYIKTGHIVYGLGNNLYARPFDAGTLKVTGGPIPIVQGVANISFVWHYDVSDTGVLVYIPEISAARRYALVWVDQKGEGEPLSAAPGDYRTPRISPDGKRLAITVGAGGKGDIWIWDIVRETMTPSTFSGDSEAALWTPDGRRIVYRSTRDGTLANIYWKAADGTGVEERLRSTFNSWNMPWSWSADGTALVLVESDLFQSRISNIGSGFL
ncbi:MAG: PD40 domain-containing protein [Acidobacteria bacterium]|nr:PD40 domain-containing protein [Acidobacteriota bacterium]